jgi:hypothetical protein
MLLWKLNHKRIWNGSENEGRMEVPANGLKKLRGFEYDLKMAHKTLKTTMIEM